MNLLSVLLQAQQGGGYSMIIMLVLMFAVMYFFMIRSQQKKQKEIQNFRKGLQVGDEVITSGGIYGKVKSIDVDYTIKLEIASGVVVKVDVNSVFANSASSQNKQ